MSDLPPGVSVRAARIGDADALGLAGYRAFRFGKTEYWQSYYRHHGHMAPSDTLVASRDDEIVAQASALRLTMSLCGEDVPFRGIAAVAVAPEWRRQRLADALMRRILRKMRRAGEALALLYPFRMSFYRRHGFGRIEWAEGLSVRPRDLPEHPPGEGVSFRPLDREAHLPVLSALYDRWRRGKTGPLCRSEYWWKARVLDRISDGALIEQNGRPCGYVLLDIPAVQRTVGEQHFVVKEIAAPTPAAYRAAFGFLRSLGNQLGSLELTLSRGEAGALLDDYPPAEREPGNRIYREEGRIVSGAMGRIVDLGRALALHPRAREARGQLGLDITDPILSGQDGSFDITFSRSGPRVSKGRTRRRRLALGIDRLSQVYFGALRSTDLLARGQISGSAHAAGLLDEALRGPSPFHGPMNAF